jgi:hypothetical protein
MTQPEQRGRSPADYSRAEDKWWVGIFRQELSKYLFMLLFLGIPGMIISNFVVILELRGTTAKLESKLEALEKRQTSEALANKSNIEDVKAELQKQIFSLSIQYAELKGSSKK